jgi:hypothetical protein
MIRWAWHIALISEAPTLRALARLNLLRPCKIGIGPAQVVFFLCFSLFLFFLFSFLKFKQFKFRNLFRFRIETNFYFKQIFILNKIRTNLRYEQILSLFKIQNMNKFRICSKFETRTKFVFERNSNLNKFWFEQIWDMNKIEICSNPKFVQI